MSWSHSVRYSVMRCELPWVLDTSARRHSTHTCSMLMLDTNSRILSRAAPQYELLHNAARRVLKRVLSWWSAARGGQAPGLKKACSYSAEL
jgi:hypothetical protein